MRLELDGRVSNIQQCNRLCRSLQPKPKLPAGSRAASSPTCSGNGGGLPEAGG